MIHSLSQNFLLPQVVFCLSASLALSAAAVVSPYHAPVVAPYHAPVVAPAYHAPVVAPAYKATPVYADEVLPYTYNYAVSDDYSNSRFNAGESSDGAGNAEGSYSVALPDGRTQTVAYKADPYNGYVADVTYEGTAVYPEAVPVPVKAYAAPVPVYHG